MKAKGIAVTLAAAAALVGAQNARQWKIGVVMDAEAATHSEYMSIPTGPWGPALALPVPLKDTAVVIFGSDYKYTARQTTNIRRGCHFIVNDPVRYVKDKDRLHILDADGRDCKLLILRQERVLPPPAPPQPPSTATRL